MGLLSLGFAKGQTRRVPTIEEAEAYPYTPQEANYVNAKFFQAAVGDPDQVKAHLLRLVEQFGVDELMTVTITYDFEARLRSYELLADVFGLSVTPTAE